MVTDKYVIWSDGSFTSMGVECNDSNTYTIGKKMIKDPVSVVFSISQVRNEQTGETEDRLNFEMIPYIFGALLTEGDNIWEIDARHVLHNNNISPALISTYLNTVMATNSAKKNADGEVNVEPAIR